jgi:hypothetical protein
VGVGSYRFWNSMQSRCTRGKQHAEQQVQPSCLPHWCNLTQMLSRCGSHSLSFVYSRSSGGSTTSCSATLLDLLNVRNLAQLVRSSLACSSAAQQPEPGVQRIISCQSSWRESCAAYQLRTQCSCNSPNCHHGSTGSACCGWHISC